MSALLETAQAAGIRLRLAGDKVRIEADREPPADLLARLRAERAQIFAELRARDAALLERCKEACKGLSLWPAELMAAMTDEDRAAQLSGREGPETLRAFAESLAARLRSGTLPEGLQAAYARLKRELVAHPGQRFASEVLTPDDDPVLLAVAVRGAGFATLRIAKDRYDAGTLLEIVHRLSAEKAA